MDWVEEYIELLYAADSNKLDFSAIDKAKQLKYGYMPKEFYKYREINEFSLKNFEDDTIWVTTANNYNDPYDCALNMTFGMEAMNRIKENTIELSKKNSGLILSNNDEKVLKEYTDLTEFHYFLAKKYIEQGKEDCDPKKIVEAIKHAIDKEFDLINGKYSEYFQKSILNCSFSEINDSILMWSHYGGYHSGFCIEYNFKQLGENHELTRMMQPIIYKDKLFDIAPYIEDSNNLNCLVSSYVAMNKSTEWEYEKEWRYSISWGPSAVPFAKSVPTPTKVFLGARIGQDNELLIKAIAKKKSIPVYKMQMKSNEFKLISIRIQ